MSRLEGRPGRRDPWVALEVGADPWRAATELRRAHERVVSGGQAPPTLRRTIAESWRRSAQGGARADGTGGAPHVMGPEELAARRRAHPLEITLPAIRQVLHPAMDEAQHIMVVADEHGTLLWVEGPAKPISKAADDMNFQPGSDWSEPGVGTNSIGTSLAAGHAIQVFSAEHFNTACHGWTCSGAPVHDPVTGRVLGVIDITSDLRTYHPGAHALVLAAARVAEGVLAEQAGRRDQQLINLYLDQIGGHMRPPSAVVSSDGRVLAAFPSGWAGSRMPGLASGGGDTPRLGVTSEPLLGGLGHVVFPLGDGRTVPAPERDVPVIELVHHSDGPTTCRLHGRTVQLSPRHRGLVTLLAANPEGLTGQQIGQALWGGTASPVTVRAEVSRVRSLLGDVIRSRPYRLAATVRETTITR